MAVSIWALVPLLAQVLSTRAVPVATIGVTTTALIAFDRMLRARHGYSPLRDMAPGLAGVAVAVAVGLPAAGLADDAFSTLAVAAGVGAVQLIVSAALGGVEDPRALLRSARPAAVTAAETLTSAPVEGVVRGRSTR